MTGYQDTNDLRAGRCSYTGCGKPLLWAITEKGHRMPLDPGPVTDGTGNVALTLRPDRSLDLATVLGPLEVAVAVEAEEALYVPHFASCKGRKRRGRR
jgi:hypothetical protein